MKLAINQSYFFPYIGYFQLIESVDTIVLYENVVFTKRSWITRNQLLDYSSGEAFKINIPVNSSRMIKDVQLIGNNMVAWKNHFLKTIYHNYRRAKYFDETYELLTRMINGIKTLSLHVFNSELIRATCLHLNINTRIKYQNEDLLELEKELTKECDKTRKRVNRIISICKKENANTYINLPGGRVLYNQGQFWDDDINLQFIQMPKGYKYNQFQHEFVPHLSIIDVLMHNGKNKTNQLVRNYSLDQTNKYNLV